MFVLSESRLFFTSRFLHVLLLRLAYTFSLACDNHVEEFSHYQKGCIAWTKGISWENEEGIKTVVELISSTTVLIPSSF